MDFPTRHPGQVMSRSEVTRPYPNRIVTSNFLAASYRRWSVRIHLHEPFGNSLIAS